MKKVIYIILTVATLALIAGGVYIYLENRGVNDTADEVIIEYGAREEPEDLVWTEYFPAVVPEYTDGEIKQITVVDPKNSVFEDEIVVVIEKTSYEEFNKYVENLEKSNWIITYGSIDESLSSSTIQLSLKEKSISAIITDDGILRLSSYTRVED